MAGCNGGNCQCRQARQEKFALNDALAQVIVDNRVVRWAVDYSRRHPEATADDIVGAYHDAKILGEV